MTYYIDTSGLLAVRQAEVFLAEICSLKEVVEVLSAVGRLEISSAGESSVSLEDSPEVSSSYSSLSSSFRAPLSSGNKKNHLEPSASQ